ncbi:class I SAM-dependent methyltransferase [uncultured Winogradskyella sp.]|uniref:class I SAM-dependent methyltransferase n=1 Tax=uncultured Winogradskyella sp. TaxID=395353 RepID=UPI00260A4995|nr:class I SAM-dependent methyltransferase [uncultured Winogradskyella sp.]
MPNDFDIASTKYDTTFTFSNIGKAQRHMVFKYLNPILNQGKKLSILELNCGTGEDAIHFAKLNHNVLATDISEGMIKVARAKTNSKNLIFKTQDINTITTNTFKTKFDFIFSNFGGLNCLSKAELDLFFKKAHKLLNPEGKIVLVIMPKHCLWERLYFILKGSFKKANRRKTNEKVIANVDGVAVKTWYYNPEEIVSLNASQYATNNIKPIGLAIPPSYLENSFLAKKPFLSIFKSIDAVITGSYWAKYADHFLIELKKN